jgi:hypothetical protein
LVGALLEPRLLATLPAVSGELGRAIARHGVIDLRSYAESGAEGGVEARIGAGLEAGAGWGWERRALRLTAAYTALPGLPLLPRGDCAGAGAPGLV